MGVTGLWDLLSPVGHRVSNDQVRNKVLAVDVSIWLTQFIKAMRETDGATVRNAHLLGVLRRCLKLLFLAVRPVLIFDGDTPAIKRRTLTNRGAARQKHAAKLRRLAEKLLVVRLKKSALDAVIPRHLARAAANASRKSPALALPAPVDVDTDLSRQKQQHETVSPHISDMQPSSQPSAINPERMTHSVGIDNADLEAVTDEAAAASIFDEQPICLPEDLDTIDDETLIALPPQLQSDVLKQLKHQHRARRREHILQRQHDPAAFSQQQIDAFLSTTALNRRINNIRNTINIHSGASRRIASNCNRQYLLQEHGVVTNGQNDEFDSDDDDLLAPGRNSAPKPLDILAKLRAENDAQRAWQKQLDDTEEPVSRKSKNDVSGVGWASKVLDGKGKLVLGNDRILQTSPRDMDELSDKPLSEVDDRRTRGEDSTQMDRGENGGGTDSDDDVEWEDGNVESDPEEIMFMSRPEDPSLAKPKVADGAENRTSVALDGGAPSISNEGELRTLANRSGAAGPVMQHPLIDLDLYENEDYGLATYDKEDKLNLDNVAPSVMSPPSDSPVRSNIAVGSLQHQNSAGTVTEAGAQKSKGQTAPNAKGFKPQLSQGFQPQLIDLDVGEGQYRCTKEGTKKDQGDRSDVLQDSPSPTLSTRVDGGSTRLACQRDQSKNEKKSSEGKEKEKEVRTAMDSSIRDEHKEHESCFGGVKHIYSMPSKTVHPNDLDAVSARMKGRASMDKKTTGRVAHDEQRLRDEQGESDVDEITPAPVQVPGDRTPKHVLNATKSSDGDAKQKKLADLEEEADLQLAIARSLNVNRSGKTGAGGISSLPEQTKQLQSEERSKGSLSPQSGIAKDGGNTTPVTSRVAPTVLDNGSKSSPEGKEDRLDADADEITPLERTECTKAASIGATGIQFSIEGGAVENELQVTSAEDVEKLRQQLDREELEIRRKKSTHQAGTEVVSDEMYSETRDMLKLLGIPYLEAPMEAEAQCAFLNMHKVVDGIITEDSDSFLFGAETVYRQLFAHDKFAEAYEFEDIQKKLGLGRNELIRLAYLLGSDYTAGVRGVGVVNSMEVLEAFPGENGLHQFREWTDKVTVLDKEPDEETMVGSSQDAVRVRFCWKHRNMKRNWEIREGFPNPAVAEAYWKPMVDASTNKFKWGRVDFDGLSRFCWDKFGWGQDKYESLIAPLRDELKARAGMQQRRIDEFFKPHRFATIRSERLQKAVKGIVGDEAKELMSVRMPKIPKRKRSAVAFTPGHEDEEAQMVQALDEVEKMMAESKNTADGANDGEEPSKSPPRKRKRRMSRSS